MVTHRIFSSILLVAIRKFCIQAFPSPLASMSHAVSWQDDAYAVLGVSRTAEASVIRAAYLRLAREHHPDKHRAENASEQMQNIVHAYEVLCDPTSRAAYDEWYDAMRAQRRTQVRIAERVPLDTLDIIEEPSPLFVYPCRCGQAYITAPEAIVQGTRLVACTGCSETIEIVCDEDD